MQAMSKNRFLYILKCFHIVSRSSMVHDCSNPRYNSTIKIQWLLTTLVESFKKHWNALEFLCINECMVGYNGCYCSFKQCMPLKPVTHGIKVWCLARFVTKYILNLEVYVEAANEAIVALPPHAYGSGVGVVARLTQG